MDAPCEGTPYGQALGSVAAFSVAGAVWLCAVGRRAGPGAARLAAVLPLLAANLAAPRLFCRAEDTVTIILLAFNTAWLTSFKALAWAVNRGPLCEEDFTLPQFAAVLLAPITPQYGARPGKRLPRRSSKGRLDEDAGGPLRMLGSWMGKVLFMALLVWMLQYDLPRVVYSIVLALGLYCLLSLIMDGPAALIVGLIGLRVSPHFDQPWRATSIASFWSKRWDLAAGNTLRQLIFDPIAEGHLVGQHSEAVAAAAAAPPPPAASQRGAGKRQQAAAGAPPGRNAVRQALGTTASFLTSGLIHELIFWYITGHTTRGVWLSYFLVQAPLIIAERMLLGALKARGVMLPAWLRCLYTVGGEAMLGYHLFWHPCDAHGVTTAAVGNVRKGLYALAALLTPGRKG